MQVDKLQKHDRSNWERLYRAYAAFYERPMSPAILSVVWNWIFAPDHALFALAARNDAQQMVGLLHYRAMPSPLRGQLIGFADDMFIDPEHRGQGGAEALAAALKQDAKARGWPIVRWITTSDNARAKALYDQVAEHTVWQTYEMKIPD